MKHSCRLETGHQLCISFVARLHSVAIITISYQWKADEGLHVFCDHVRLISSGFENVANN